MAWVELLDIDDVQDIDLDLTGDYIVMNDIDASATTGWNETEPDSGVFEGFLPIGRIWPYFGGTIDGNGKKITGLYINRTDMYCGLIGGGSPASLVYDLGLEDVDITGGHYTGGFVGIYGTQINCWCSGAVSGGMFTGGFVGSEGTQINCWCSGAVSGGMFTGGFVGGLGTQINCYATGSVTGTNDHTGGFMGSQGTQINCWCSGAVSGAEYTGGFVGSRGTITNCLSLSDVASSHASDYGAFTGRHTITSGDNFYSTDATIKAGGIAQGDGVTGEDTDTLQTLATFSAWDIVAEADLVNDSGTATSGAATTLTDTGQAWTSNEHANRTVHITGGTGAGQVRRIESNTATALTVTGDWVTNPDDTSVYEIRHAWYMDDAYPAHGWTYEPPPYPPWIFYL